MTEVSLDSSIVRKADTILRKHNHTQSLDIIDEEGLNKYKLTEEKLKTLEKKSDVKEKVVNI